MKRPTTPPGWQVTLTWHLLTPPGEEGKNFDARDAYAWLAKRLMGPKPAKFTVKPMRKIMPMDLDLESGE